jgi:hypothetical protein
LATNLINGIEVSISKEAAALRLKARQDDASGPVRRG